MFRLLFGLMVMGLSTWLPAAVLTLSPVLTASEAGIPLEKVGQWAPSDLADNVLQGKMLSLSTPQGSPQQLWLTSLQLEQLIRQQHPDLGVVVRGPERVLIRSQGQLVSSRKIESYALAYLQAELEKQNFDFKVKPLGTLKDVRATGKLIAMSASRFRQGSFGKREAIKVTLKTQDSETTIPVWFTVSIYQNAWVTEQAESALTHFSDAVLTTKRVNVAGLGSEPADPDHGMRLNKHVPAGHILTQDDLEPVPLVEKTMPVQVISQAGHTVVHTRGQALEDGFSGESVSFLVRGSQKPGQGVVIEKGVVLVKDDNHGS